MVETPVTIENAKARLKAFAYFRGKGPHKAHVLAEPRFNALPSIREFTADKMIRTGWIPKIEDMMTEDWIDLSNAN